MGLQFFEESAGVDWPYSRAYAAPAAEACGGAAAAAEVDDDAQDDWRARHDFFEEY